MSPSAMRGKAVNEQAIFPTAGLTRREAVLSNLVVLVLDHFAASAAINSPQRA